MIMDAPMCERSENGRMDLNPPASSINAPPTPRISIFGARFFMDDRISFPIASPDGSPAITNIFFGIVLALYVCITI